MSANRNGKVVTFYSYKGGTGRTMALANVAWILAANGKRVLVVDWDLESPGLHRFFRPFLEAEELTQHNGVIEMVRDYEQAAAEQTAPHDDRLYSYHARVQKHAFSIDWSHFPPGATLDFLSAGRQNSDYSIALSGMDWDDFYERLNGSRFFEALRTDMRRHYDYTFIDSRTGLSDVADICTMALPDVLVGCFTFSEQGIDGAADVARRVERYELRDIRVLPVPMRVDPAEKAKADAGREVAKQRFVGLPAEMDSPARDHYWLATQVPYQAYYAYEETLATFGDKPGGSGTLLSAYEAIAAQITEGEVRSLPAMEESLREATCRRFERQVVPVEDKVVLRYAAPDQVWAEWISHVLAKADVKVYDPLARDESAVPEGEHPRELMIVSHTYAAGEGREKWKNSTKRAPLAVYIDEQGIVPRAESATSTNIAGLREPAAAEQVLRMVGRPEARDVVLAASGLRFPATGMAANNLPARNRRFTGREEDLRQLRKSMRERSQIVISGAHPVALQGMGGIGKTLVALEYAYRFSAAYDLIWWVNAEQVAFIDVQLGDLGARMGVPAAPTSPENARAVLQALQSVRPGDPYARWLLIFDNAEDLEKVGEFLPKGPGHVLITSRNPQWGDQAAPIQLDVFQRRDSVEHLMKRVESMTREEADQVAELLGDLPIAVNAAAAWLASSGRSVRAYLSEIERLGPSAIPIVEELPHMSAAQGSSVAATWDLSLDLLERRSPAAYRLLQLCSVLAPEITLDLVYSDEIAEALKPFDRSVSEPLVRGSLVTQIHRLSLLRLDQGPRAERRRDGESGRVQVHRLLQHVVRSRMTEEERRVAQHQVHLMLSAYRAEGEVDDPALWQRLRTLWPHLEVSEAVSCHDEAVRRLLIDRVRYLFIRGDNARGLDRANQTEAIWRVELDRLRTTCDTAAEAVEQLRADDDGSPEATRRLREAVTAHSKAVEERETLQRQLLHLRFNKANILCALGQFTNSREVDEEVLKEQTELLGVRHPHTMMTAGGLARDLRSLGQYREALERDRVTYSLVAEFFGEEHRRTLAAQNNLATSYRLIGDFRRARELDEAVYAGRRAILGELHPDTLASAGNVGRDLREAGEYERSAAQLKDVDSAYQREHPDSTGALNARANYAISLRAAGRAEEASRLLDMAYEQLSEVSPTSPDTLACRLSLAVNYLAIEDNRRAEEELRAVRLAYETRLTARHPHTLVCVNNLAMVARAKKDTRQARTLATAAARDLSTVLGPDHPYALAARTNLAVCVAEEGDYDEALEIVNDTLTRLTAVLGLAHPDTLRCKANQALLLAKMSGSNDQLTTLQDDLGALIGDDHPAMIAFRDGRFLHRIIDPHPF